MIAEQRKLRLIALMLKILVGLLCLTSNLSAAIKLDEIKLPPGFKIGVFQANVPGARSLAASPSGTVFVGTRDAGKVYAIRDGKLFTLASGLTMPNGVAFRDGALFVAEINRVSRLDNIEHNLSKPPKPVVISKAFPSDEHHGWKFIAFGPDGYLYVPVGAPCNICERLDNPKYASITRMKPDGSALEVYASGIRNTVGFDWRPGTNELWFTDNGRDMLGDDIPPDELNRATSKGQHFGYPYCHGGTIKDPNFGAKRPCSAFVAPAQNLGAHVAALGMRFYTGKMFPNEYKNQIFIAEHGSWNRSEKSGYKISLVRQKDGKATSYETFAEGWKKGETAWGRPVDLLVRPDGSMLVSDDYAGAIYRIYR